MIRMWGQEGKGEGGRQESEERGERGEEREEREERERGRKRALNPKRYRGGRTHLSFSSATPLPPYCKHTPHTHTHTHTHTRQNTGAETHTYKVTGRYTKSTLKTPAHTHTRTDTVRHRPKALGSAKHILTYLFAKSVSHHGYRSHWNLIIDQLSLQQTYRALLEPY